MTKKNGHRDESADAEKEENGQGDLTLEISVAHASFQRGKKITVEATLHNKGDRPVTVNSRLAANGSGFPGELFFAIMGPSGKKVPFSSRVNIGTPSARDFDTLPPGESVTKKHILQDYYKLPRPGNYSVKATYTNKWPGEDGAQKAWLGTLHSNEIEFQIEEP